MFATDPPAAAGTLTSQVLTALMNHYRKPGEPRAGVVLIPEPEAPASQRRCDLVTVSMMRSRGYGIDGHEIKTSRADWLRELADPAKAEAWWPYCSRWHIVAPPGIVQPAELPEGWGLLEVPRTGRRFRAVVPAAVKEPVIDVPLLVELLRRADGKRLGEIDQLRNQHRSELRVNGERIRQEAAEGGLNESTRSRLELLTRVETAIGRKLTDYAWADDQVTPLELASALADVGDQVAQARKRKAIADMHGNLAKVAQAIVRDLAKLA